jgi:hypothetical protein
MEIATISFCTLFYYYVLDWTVHTLVSNLGDDVWGFSVVVTHTVKGDATDGLCFALQWDLE